MTSYKRGLALEELVAGIFRAKGYYVKHNIKLVGRSGVEHQIDVYAEYKAPLHTSRIIVECKSYDKPIDKDIVMKLIHEVEDLGVDKGILVTTSYFTSDAISTATGRNVDLWDGVKLQELLKEVEVEIEGITISNVFHVVPYVSIETSVELVDKMLRGFFGRKGVIESMMVIFYPYYELDIDAKIYEAKGIVKKKLEEKIVSARVLVDPITRQLCHYDFTEGVIAIATLPPLFEEEQRVFQILLHAGSLTADAIAALIGSSTAKARRILQGLVAKGLVRLHRNRQALYEIAMKIPEPHKLITISSTLMLNEGEPSGVKLEHAFSLDKAETIIKTLWRGNIKDYRVVFYPYCVCKITQEGKRYVKAVDLINGKIDERVSHILTTSYDALPF